MYEDTVFTVYKEKNLNTLNSFVNLKHKFTDNLSLSAGIHYQHFFYNNTKSLEPRVGLSYQYTQKSRLSMAYGNHSQKQPKFFYFLKDPGASDKYGKNLKFTKSHQFVMGHDYSFNHNLRLKTEVYYQHLYDVPVHAEKGNISLINFGASSDIEWMDSLINKGTGENYGIDLTFEKFLSKGYYFLVTTSLFNSKYKGGDGKKRNTTYNGNYVFNALGGYEFKVGKSSLMNFNLRWVYAGGMRYTPVDFKKSQEIGDTYYIWDRTLESKTNDYLRIDFRVGLVIQRNKVTHELGWEIVNLTNNKNIHRREYDVELNKVVYSYHQGFFPMALYRISF